MATSGTTNFSLAVPDLVLEAFDRIQIRSPEITLDHLISARRSLGLVFQSKWSNRGVNLWKVQLSSIPLIQGTSIYTLPASTVMILDAYVETYGMNTAVSITPAFTTTSTSTTVTITQANTGVAVGNYIQVVVPVAIGGIVVSGFYQVVSVPTTSTYTITAASAATSGVSGGTVPSFTTTSASTTVTVVLANHGLLAGQAFNIQVSTTVGGITLSGSYTVATVTNSSTFTITAPYAAGYAQTVSENSGQTQISTQDVTASPTDRVLYPISRTDYSNLPDKVTQGPPTTYWFDRTSTPTVTLWQPPDANGPYNFFYYAQVQIQDANILGGQSLDMPPRFYEAAAADLTAALAWKFPPNPASGMTIEKYEMAAKAAWAEAAAEDRERVSMNLTPDFSDYFR